MRLSDYWEHHTARNRTPISFSPILLRILCSPLTTLYQRQWLILHPILIDLLFAFDALGDLSLKIFSYFGFWGTMSSSFFPYSFLSFFAGISSVRLQVWECSRGQCSGLLFHPKWSYLSHDITSHPWTDNSSIHPCTDDSLPPKNFSRFGCMYSAQYSSQVLW